MKADCIDKKKKLRTLRSLFPRSLLTSRYISKDESDTYMPDTKERNSSLGVLKSASKEGTWVPKDNTSLSANYLKGWFQMNTILRTYMLKTKAHLGKPLSLKWAFIFLLLSTLSAVFYEICKKKWYSINLQFKILNVNNYLCKTN